MKEVKLTINKNKVTLPLGLGFLGDCLENLDLSIKELCDKLDKNPFKWIPTIMHESYKHKCYLDDVEVVITLNEFVKFLNNETGTKTMRKFLLAFTEFLFKDVPKQDADTQDKQSDSKKK